MRRKFSFRTLRKYSSVKIMVTIAGLFVGFV